MALGIKKRGLGLSEPAVVAMQTMRAHKMRSFLMLLGIILSVGTLILVVSLIECTNRYIADRVANLGANVFLLNRFPIITDSQEFVKALRRNKEITWEDYTALRDSLQLPLGVGVEVRKSGTVKGTSESLEDIDVRGVTANIGEMDVEEPASGRYILDVDNEHHAAVTFIGSEVASRLFPSVDPLGKTVHIDNRPYEVVGVAKPLGSALGQSQDGFVYMPVQTFLKVNGSRRSLSVNI
ncbi:MAG: ABC transporter permease, partial [Terriglobales bacterium]